MGPAQKELVLFVLVLNWLRKELVLFVFGAS